MNSVDFEALPNLSAQLSLSGLTWDIAAVFFVAAIIFIFGVTSGRDKMLALLLALYAGAVIARTVPSALSSLALSGLRVSPYTQLTAFLSLVLQFLPYGAIKISSLAEQMFLSGPAPLLWAVAPVVFLLFLKVEDEFED